MKVFKSFRLLSKTTLFYLIFILITFFFGAQFMINKIDQFAIKETEHSFKKREKHLIKYLEEHDTLKRFRTTLISPINKNDTINYPRYNDTLIYNDELGESHLHRQKVLIIKAKEEYFLVKMVVNIDVFTKLKRGISKRIILAFIILALAIILFTVFMSGYLLKPFHRILEHMNSYKVGKGIKFRDVITSTLEFKKMQFLFKRMIDRTEDDYRKLKEYTENMAHEIQTPLTIIRNKTEKLISDETVMDNHKDSVKVIYDETNHLSKLGSTLNLLTKIENQEYTNSVSLTTEQIVLKHLDSISELVELKSLLVETKLNSEHKILIDPFLFDIILKNLLRNAVRYASNDGPIKVETTQSSLKISNFGSELKVTDNQIFERFYTSDCSNQSLGLGLALVKRICDLNQLRIRYSYMENQHIFIIDSLN